MINPARYFAIALTLVCTCQLATYAQPVRLDSLQKILQIQDTYAKEKTLINYLKSGFNLVPLKEFQQEKNEVDKALQQYSASNALPISLFIESIYQARISHFNEAENNLLNAIVLTKKQPDNYLSYIFFTHLAFVQLSKGDIIETMSSYRLAKKEAIILKDPYLQVLIDINISDICYRNNFLKQSLFYLDQAQGLIVQNNIREHRLINVIYYNKAETFYRMARLDSLAVYSKKLEAAPVKTENWFTLSKRTDYYQLMLQHRYEDAIRLIASLQKNPSFVFEDFDGQSFASAYFNAGQPDSAKKIIDKLIANNQVIHFEILPQLYQMLGDIALKTNQYGPATLYYRMALRQLDDRIKGLSQAGSVSTQMRVDEMEDSYGQRDEAYKRERMWLWFAVVGALLTTAIFVMVYRNAKQKRYYEKLLFAAQKKELASFNSHEVRRHLSNILGMIDALKGSENKHEDYQQLEGHLFYSAEQLDNAIRDISQKLDS